MNKVNQSKRLLDDSAKTTYLANHGSTYTDIKDIIEDESESISKKVKKEENLNTPTYDDIHHGNSEKW